MKFDLGPAVAGALLTVAVAYAVTPIVTERSALAARHKELISIVPVVAGVLGAKRIGSAAAGMVIAGAIMTADNLAVRYLEIDPI